MRSFVNILLVLLAFSLLVGGYFYFGKGKKVRTLPYYAPVEKGLQAQKDEKGRHTAADFSLTDQTGKSISRKDFSNSVSVVDFFFTTCEGICPVMARQMERVYKEYKGNPRVKFISHTVNPENDSVEALAAYAQKYNADPSQWFFVTGDKKQIYDLARHSYLISDTRGDGGKEDFVHSQNFALIDPAGHVRGLYDGTDPVDVDRLIVEIRVLLGE
ncbi:MAG TPA: SCO family protein [Bacteroidia bacterium]|nr:SCO family protein [Bacteroidia bacterium]